MCVTDADNVDSMYIYHSYLSSNQFVIQQDILTQRAHTQKERWSDVIGAEIHVKVRVTHDQALNI